MVAQGPQSGEHQLLRDIFVLWNRIAEAFGHASQVNQTNTRPDQTQNHRAFFQVNPQCADGQSTTHRMTR